jgi:hypothetical protein
LYDYATYLDKKGVLAKAPPQYLVERRY